MNLSTMTAFKTLNYDGIGIAIEGDVLRKCQKVILKIAEDVVGLLEKHGIWYQLSGGTALGAVREQGFIPWDDDIDLNVLGKDFETIGRLVEAEYPDTYVFHYYNTPGYGIPIGRIVLKNSVFLDRDGVGVPDCGFFIDLFPIENVPDNPALRKLHGYLCQAAGGLLSCRKFFKNRSFFRALAAQNPEIRTVFRIKIALGGLIAFLPLPACARITDHVFGLCRDENSEYVAIPSGRKHYFGEMYRRSGMIGTEAHVFEGHRWQVAKDYDAYFKVLYGPDYMTPPPPEAREHHIIMKLVFPEDMSQEAEQHGKD